MPLLRTIFPGTRQLEFSFDPLPTGFPAPRRGRDPDLETQGRQLLAACGFELPVGQLRVEWNPRLVTCAGRAHSPQWLITLNPILLYFAPDEVDRTFRHELAHLLARFRARGRRIRPHGMEWKTACRDLGIGDEKRCHELPLKIKTRVRRFLYHCPGCRRQFPRVRRIKRALACLACCRAHNGGKFDARFRLRLARSNN